MSGTCTGECRERPAQHCYRKDPAWGAARTDYVDEARPDEDADGVFVRRLLASVRLYEIEIAYGCDR